MDNQKWKFLLEKYLSNTITKEELSQFLKITDESSDHDALTNELRNHWDHIKLAGNHSMRDWDSKFDNMMKEAGHETPVVTMNKRRNRWALLAAAVLIFVLAGAYIFKKNDSENVIADAKLPVVNDVKPGGNKALLTLADGTTVILDSTTDGTITQQGGTKVITIDGQVAYNANSNSTEVLYNTITTPKGGQYQIVLADGSKAWLNAASSLRFPTSFVGNERRVELIGEGYFEIAKNDAMPFYVKANNMQVEVVGTHFNINSYADEELIKTTLVEGKVKVLNGSAAGILNPGQQARVGAINSLKIVNDVDIEEVVAWKNGFTAFRSADIKSIMRQVARWYNLEVKYVGVIPDRRFTGEISRHVNLSQLLKILQASGISFTTEGQTITVKP